MMRSIVMNVGIVLIVVCLLLAGCGGGVDGEVTEFTFTPVCLIPQLNFELDDFISEKVWVSGYYGDSSISGGGYGYLVTDSYMLLVDEKLPDHCCVLLDGDLPDDVGTGAEILLYGEVKDFAETYDVFTVEPTPLITVEQYHILSPSAGVTSSFDSLFDVSFDTAVPQSFSVATEAYAADNGTKVKDCDRALILSGGVDAKNNHARYRENVKMKYEKLRELGFTDEQIVVLYNDGAAINVTGVNNITDAKASKATVNETLEKFKNEMEECCTLTIMVTDHGTGYNQEQCYHGARPALDPARESGKTYAENTTCLDLRKKVYQATPKWTFKGKEFWAEKDKTGRVTLYMKANGKVYEAYDADGDGYIGEPELDVDVDGDGAKKSQGYKVAFLESKLAAPLKHRNNQWDTDGDGTKDVRVSWNSTASRYVLERLKDGVWKEMAHDTDGDYIIDKDDGGIDWNLDGDKNDQIGFHEGINLWGREVLWDDELADLLKPLHDKGIHIVVEMVSCFSGGFVENLKGVVDKIVTYSGEDTKHWNRVAADGKTIYAADQKAFVGNLTGIDLESWNAAFEKGKEADTAKWQAEGSNPKTKNEYQSWEKTPVPLDASIEFNTWTINGVPVPPGTYTVPPDTIIDIRYTEHVSGEEDAIVEVHETAWLFFHYMGPDEGTLIHAVNCPYAVSMSPPADILYQMTTVEGQDAPYCTEIWALYCEPIKLGVEIVSEQVVCVNYTKTINWLGMPSPEEILFDVYGLIGDSFTLTSRACVELEGDENPENDCTDWSPELTIVIGPP